MKSTLLTYPDKASNTCPLNLKDIRSFNQKMGFQNNYHFKHQVLSIEEKFKERLHYDFRTLDLLDFLRCPILFLPLFAKESAQKKIGFFTDLRFTNSESISFLKSIITNLNCALTIINIPDKHQPPINQEYALALFKELGLAGINGSQVNLINLQHQVSKKEITTFLIKNKINVLAAVQARKQLLYHFS